MKTCSKCGLQFGDEWLACPKCGGAPNKETVQDSYHYGTGYTQSTVTKGESKSTVNRGYTPNTDSFGEYASFFNENDLPWYLRTWCIILAFLFIWPAGIVLLIMRLSGKYPSGSGKPGVKKNNTPMTVGRVAKIAGGVICLLIAVAGLAAIPNSYDASDAIMNIGMTALFAVFGILLIKPKGAGIKGGKVSNKKWARYEALIDNRGNTKISFIASKMGISEQKAATDIQKMINKGFLKDDANGIAAYINGQYNLVVMTKDGVPIVPVEETMAKEIAAKKAKEEADTKRRAEEEEKRKRENATSIEEKTIYAIQDAVAAAEDVEVIEYLKKMERSIKTIVKLCKDDPSHLDRKSVQNMKKSYLPSTIELIGKYQKSTTSEDTKAQIKGMFSTLATAFKNIENQLKQHVDIDTELDIDVMRQTLEREGLLDSDFNINL
ncbi:MAG: hypothetical protein KBS66_06205 [Eubacterium sp.]|nr:hypothetical protein [Candidatus Colimonas fimequi]